MKIVKTKFKDTYLINHSKKNDKRGFFMRGICTKILKNKNVSFNIKQTNYSYNKKVNIERFSFSITTFFRKKIITCVKGKLLLVIVNIDKKSNNYLKHLKFILSDNLNRSVLISKNCATVF